VIGDALQVRAGQTVLVHGAGGVTGGMLVQLAAHRGATVIATTGADSAGRVAAMGASTVLDYHQTDWPERVRVLTGGGADAAANAARAGSVEAVRAVRGPASAVGEATALFIAGFGAAGYATRRDLTAIARASFWVGRTAVTDQGPARVVHRRDRMASGATVDGSST